MSLTIFTVLGAYLALLAVVFVAQRRLVFPAPPLAKRPSADVEVVELRSTVLLVSRPAQPDGRWVLHFHGNGTQLAETEWRAERWRAQGVGFVAAEYPGYGLAKNKGAPSEDSILEAADEALAYARTTLNVPDERLIVSGQSLGTGPAVALAARGVGAKVLLVTPFTSLPDVGAAQFPFLPVRWLMRDRFDSAGKAAHVRQPVLIVHGTADEVVPFSHGEALAQAFPRATLMRIEAGQHNDVGDRPDVWQALTTFAAR